MSDDLLTRVRDEMRARLRELEPLAAEYHKLREAFERLETTDGQPASTPKRTSRRRKRRGPVSVTGTRRPGREPVRAKQLLGAVRDQPGITLDDAAEKIGVPKQNLYRVANQLRETGELRADGKRLYAHDVAAPVSSSNGNGNGAEAEAAAEASVPA